jgi:sialidase-1
VQKFVVSNDPAIYECHPDVTMGSDGNRLIAIFTERTHHWLTQAYSRCVIAISDDRGRTWSPKIPISEDTAGLPYFYDALRISTLRSGRILALLPRIPHDGGEHGAHKYNLGYKHSDDNGESWSEFVEIPIHGIAPDQVVELDDGRLLVAVHHYVGDYLVQYLIHSDDGGDTWSAPVRCAGVEGHHLCEASILQLGGTDTLAMFLRENSGLGIDCQLTISGDRGESWGPLADFPLPGCHRPVAGHLNDGRVLVLWAMRHAGGRRTTLGSVFAEDVLLHGDFHRARIDTFPLDYDRSTFPDTGYTGWVQFPDDEIYAVNYIADDAGDCAQIRGYSFRMEDFVIPSERRYTKGMVRG